MTEEESSLEDFTEKHLKEFIEPLEDRLGISSGFFRNLLIEDSDWAFIIKLYALIEVAVAHYLATKLHQSVLQDKFLRLDLCNKKTGQTAFLKALGLLEEQRSFIKAIAAIRNDFVHDISNVELKFSDYFKNVDYHGKFNELSTALKKQVPTIPHESIKNMIKKTPKFTIWIFGMFLMREIYSGIKPRLLGELFKKI